MQLEKTYNPAAIEINFIRNGLTTNTSMQK